MVANLLGMHVAGADGADPRVAVAMAECEGNQQMASRLGASDGEIALFGRGMAGIGVDCRSALKHGLDLFARDAVLAAFRPVAIIPVKPGNAHTNIYAYVYANARRRRIANTSSPDPLTAR